MQGMDVLSHDEIRHIMSFSDDKSLTRLSGVNRLFWDLSRSRVLWQTCAIASYPHLGTSLDTIPYMGDWRDLVIDQNKRNRSGTLTVQFPNMSTNLLRRTDGHIEIDGYRFSLIVDPMGNPIVVHAQPAISVYLKCEPPVHEWNFECCCRFKLLLVGKKRNRVWMSSSLPNDSFSNARNTWGVHQFIEREKFMNPDNGFIQDDTMTIRAHIQILMMDVVVVRNHEGHVGIGFPLDGEVFAIRQNTTLKAFKKLIGETNLWAFTQPHCWDVYSPRIALCDEDATMHSLLSRYMMNGLCTARVWANDIAKEKYIHVKIADNDTMRLIQTVSVSRLQDMLTHDTELHKEYSAYRMLEKTTTDDLINGDIAVICRRDIDIRHVYLCHLRNQTRLIHLLNRMTVRLKDIVLLYEKCGGQGFRIVNTYFKKTNQDSIQTLRYISDRHLGFCCDGCGEYDFRGMRYSCTVCYDFDLCSKCQQNNPIQRHRYIWDTSKKRYKRIWDGNHSPAHEMSAIPPVFIAH